MAKIVKLVEFHSCYLELGRDVDTKKIYYGTLAQCSCGKIFEWTPDQRDGGIWLEKINVEVRNYLAP